MRWTVTARHVTPSAPEFALQFSCFTRSAFRIETLPAYGNSGEDDSLQAFLRGHTPQPHPGKLEWMALLRAARKAGSTVQRVHVVTEPLSDYLCFELGWSYAHNTAAGEDVRIIACGDGKPWPADVPREDFWLFDSTNLFALRYTDDGTWMGAEHVDAPEAVARAGRVRDIALRLSQPWGVYIAQRPELGRRVPAAPAP